MAAVIKENLLQVPFRTMREQMADVLNRRYAKYRKIGAYLE
jgi:acetyl-CoA carboxylase carboxyl transferase subunit alpha